MSAGSADGSNDTSSSYDSGTKSSGERVSSDSSSEETVVSDSSPGGETTGAVDSGTADESPVTSEPAVTGTAKLSWVAPATRVNGEGLAMGELDSYIISYGQDASDLSKTIEINDASTMEYTIDNLGTGEWFFSIQVVDTDGLISAPSDVVSKTI
ncbi:fibronectin type III domain-containing protein [Marinobacter sp.]|uniref:fibronectin type III domain-containing protein n=1 Tax=Marinobacter sp. TaxID=50741 RepID=UPI003567EB7F